MSNDDNKPWTTEDEIAFVDNLGKTGNRNRKISLETYLKITKNRTDWGKIDWKEVRGHTLNLLNEEKLLENKHAD
jgi:hypothetical protein